MPRPSAAAPALVRVGLPTRVAEYEPELGRLVDTHAAAERERVERAREPTPFWFMRDPETMAAASGRGRKRTGDERLHRLQVALARFDDEIMRREGTSGRSSEQQW